MRVWALFLSSEIQRVKLAQVEDSKTENLIHAEGVKRTELGAAPADKTLPLVRPV